jgi:hypothetical protein
VEGSGQGGGEGHCTYRLSVVQVDCQKTPLSHTQPHITTPGARQPKSAVPRVQSGLW